MARAVVSSYVRGKRWEKGKRGWADGVNAPQSTVACAHAHRASARRHPFPARGPVLFVPVTMRAASFAAASLATCVVKAPGCEGTSGVTWTWRFADIAIPIAASGRCQQDLPGPRVSRPHLGLENLAHQLANCVGTPHDLLCEVLHPLADFPIAPCPPHASADSY